MANSSNNQLPEEVSIFLFGYAANDGCDRVISAHGLKKEDYIALFSAVESIVKGDFDLPVLPDFLEEVLQLDKAKSKLVAIDLAGNLLVPLSGFTPGVNEAITSFGGDPSVFASLPKVEKKVEDIAGEARAAAADFGDILTDPVLQGRLEQILAKYLFGELDRGTSIELMKRLPKVGGLGVSPSEAADFLNAADEEREAAKMVSEVEEVAVVEPIVETKPAVEKKSVVESTPPPPKPKPPAPKPPVPPPAPPAPPALPVPPKPSNKPTPRRVVTADSSDQPSVPKKSPKPPQPKRPLKPKNKPPSPPPAPPAKLPVESKKPQQAVTADSSGQPIIKKPVITPESINKPLPKKEVLVPPPDLLDSETMSGPGAVATDAPTMTAPVKLSLKELRKKARSSSKKRSTKPAAPKGDVEVSKQVSKPQPSGKAINVRTEFKIGNEPEKLEKTKVGVDVFSKEDEKEIAEIRKNSSQATAINSSDQQLLNKIAAEAGLDLSDETIKGRFKAAVDSRMRDLRDVYETRNQLEDPVNKGGLGISGEQLAKTVEVIERHVREENEKATAKLQAQQQEKVATQKKQEADREVSLKGREQQVLAKRYAQITGQAPVKGVGVGGSRASAARSREQALSAQEAQIDTDKVRQAVNGVKAVRPVLRMSEATIAPKGGRRQVQDVRFERRLAGPIEELKVMNITAFRRLSSDSKQAADKIKDKVNLLGFEDKVSAIRAWRESPLNQQYVSLAQTALASGKAIPEVIKQLEAQGGETLTQEEVSAIVSLNGQLRF